MNEPSLEVDVHEVQQLLAADEIVLIDCREPSEWEVAKIDGAILMPMSRWQEAAADLAQHAARRIVVHCHHGGRSLRVTQWMRQNGFPNTQNMTGGIDAWSLQVDASVPQY
ncbi:MAG: rhodanese [Planctomycetales bacterium]|nr:rhodanese [Planctomycetales bacterium]